MENTVLNSLEDKVSELLKSYRRLREANNHIRAQQTALLAEYKVLKKKHERAVGGVEQMIERLQKVEQA